MTTPVYKIETYTGANLDHTITKDALRVYCKEIVTDGVGHFSFTVPTKKNGNYIYDDIALNDTVKIYFGYDSVGTTPIFVGKVGNISGPLSTETGYIRRIEGLSQGEILLRRFKKDKYYDGSLGASTIVKQFANDLGLGIGEIEGDATPVILEIKTKTYFDLLRFVSDYWYDATTQVKKDFYVDVDNNLVWKSRPFRTTGVETLTVGHNILSYRVTRDVDAVKNSITVYGAAEAPLPRDKDSYTDSLTNWSASLGTIALNGTVKKIGSYSIMGTSTVEESEFKRTLPLTTVRNINELNFWRNYTTVPVTAVVRLLAPDTSNYFEADMGTNTAWTFKTFNVGASYEYDANENPDGVWTPTGSPNWWNIQGIQFYCDFATSAEAVRIDALYWDNDRWSGSASDATSQTNYGQRDLEVTDDKLHSDSDCTKRAETLLYQLKDPPVQIDVTTLGNTNILVGDRLSMTIPAEGISNANYDVVSVEHSFSNRGFITTAVMVNSANIRQPLATDPLRLLGDLRRYVRELSLDEKLVR